MILIKNASIVNEGKIFTSDILIKNKRIEKIDSNISINHANYEVIDANGLYLLPGLIDDQVHFRDPGFPNKGTITTESMAAVAGGVTSFMDMPNTNPPTLTLQNLENKFSTASKQSFANYSFFMGVSKHNLDEALKVDNERVCGISDDGLYFGDEEGIMANHPEFLEQLFPRSESLIALHSEDDSVIKANEDKYKQIYGENIPIKYHANIRSDEACYLATKRIIEIAKKYQTRLHVLHLSSGKEVPLFTNSIPLSKKRITVEACTHHLFFNANDYDRLGAKIKWNPSIKFELDRLTLINGLNDDTIDIVATDHAPHTELDKQGGYFHAKSGAPLVQHSLLALLELYHKNELTLQKIVEKTSHHVAEIYKIIDRGYIREGYYADLVLVDLKSDNIFHQQQNFYKVGWSPFDEYQFKSKVIKTIVNGELVYNNGQIISQPNGERLLFQKIR